MALQRLRWRSGRRKKNHGPIFFGMPRLHPRDGPASYATNSPTRRTDADSGVCQQAPSMPAVVSTAAGTARVPPPLPTVETKQGESASLHCPRQEKALVRQLLHSLDTRRKHSMAPHAATRARPTATLGGNINLRAAVAGWDTSSQRISPGVPCGSNNQHGHAHLQRSHAPKEVCGPNHGSGARQDQGCCVVFALPHTLH